MDMTGEYRIPAPRQRVWEALNDPEILKQCIPGCESIEKTTPTDWKAKVTAKVGPVKAGFTGKVSLTDLDPPNGYRITGEGTGGAAGFAKGGATVKLADDGPGTLLTYVVQAQVGGKLAQIGSRLIDSTAQKMAGEFFSRFAEITGGAPLAPEITPPPAAPPSPIIPGVDERAAAAIIADGTSPPRVDPVPLGPGAASGGTTASPPPARRGLPPAVWIGAVAVLVVLLLYAFVR